MLLWNSLIQHDERNSPLWQHEMLPYSHAICAFSSSWSLISSSVCSRSFTLIQLSNSDSYSNHHVRYSVVILLSFQYILFFRSFFNSHFFSSSIMTPFGFSDCGHWYKSNVWAGSRCTTEMTLWICYVDDTFKQYASLSTQFSTLMRSANCCFSFLLMNKLESVYSWCKHRFTMSPGWKYSGWCLSS